ncbi:MAG: hypothetical protein CUN51_07505 [Candidatus Thermofonsia Clade 1 bacterium]|uniref:Uncharacterized protein n=1 Tax=Candidatus Thermofonsia Clade 1 bacterium TaxID=2364210 RepID=A0A2M8NYW3_9CHLR|nr:MAG: hypothetical protein CUN51_07505 [Candidatus Thermofonsia Clade 1 bacterium]
MATEPNDPTRTLPPEPPEIEALDAESPDPIAPLPPPPSYESPAPSLPVTHFYQPERFACLRCGSTNLARGYIVEFGGQRFEQARFAPRRVPLKWLNSLFNLRPWRKLLRLEAIACRDCGAVLLTVDPEALRRVERVRDV